MVGLLGGFEEAERAEGAAAAFDQAVAVKPGKLADLRDERGVADDVADGGHVDAASRRMVVCM